MKNSFTMIEVIFVIVILGILAAVAFPKLAATKSDARASSIAYELGDCIEQAAGSYQVNASFDINSASCNAVTVSNPCFVLTPDDANGILNVMHTAGSATGSVCQKAQSLVEKAKLSSATGVDHHF